MQTILKGQKKHFQLERLLWAGNGGGNYPSIIQFGPPSYYVQIRVFKTYLFVRGCFKATLYFLWMWSQAEQNPRFCDSFDKTKYQIYISLLKPNSNIFLFVLSVKVFIYNQNFVNRFKFDTNLETFLKRETGCSHLVSNNLVYTLLLKCLLPS